MGIFKTDEQVLKDHSISLSNGCILWIGCCDKDGYPKIRRLYSNYGNVYLAHRLAYFVSYGAIPSGYELDHKCRNRSCINPLHLEAVPHAINMERAVWATGIKHWNGRKTHCMRNHPLSGDNLVVRLRNGVPMRQCRQCRNERSASKRKSKQ